MLFREVLLLLLPVCGLIADQTSVIYPNGKILQCYWEKLKLLQATVSLYKWKKEKLEKHIWSYLCLRCKEWLTFWSPVCLSLMVPFFCTRLRLFVKDILNRCQPHSTFRTPLFQNLLNKANIKDSYDFVCIMCWFYLP